MTELATFLNNYANLVTALATAFIAGLTLFLWLENRSLRKSGIRPNVISYLIPHPKGTGGVNFILANIGQGPALNVSFELGYDQDDFKMHEVLLENDPKRTRINILPQGEKISVIFGISFKLADKKNGYLKPFTIKINYTDINGKDYISKDSIDISQFAGLKGMFEKPAEHEISDSLIKIEKHIAKFVGNNLKSFECLDQSKIDSEYREVKPVQKT